MDKVDHKKKVDLLEPIPVPTRPFESISMDYIVDLPNAGDLDIIMLMVDHLIKICNIIKASKYALADCSTIL